MVIHPYEIDMRGSGQWDKQTGRYIPMAGGSRSRLPVADGDGSIPRYHGFVGIDEKDTEGVHTMAGLFEHIGGEVNVQRGEAGALVSRIQEVVDEQRKAEEEDSAGQGPPRPSEE